MTGCNNVPYQIHLIHVLTPDKTVRSYQCKNFTGLVMAQNIQRATIERSAEITVQLNSLPAFLWPSWLSIKNLEEIIRVTPK